MTRKEQWLASGLRYARCMECACVTRPAACDLLSWECAIARHPGRSVMAAAFHKALSKKK